MIRLPEILDRIEGLNHSLYADDITLWVIAGSDGRIQDIRQTAIDAIEKYVKLRGLARSPQKSDLLLYQATMRGRNRALEVPKIELSADGDLIPFATSIRILGLRIQANGTKSDSPIFVPSP